MPRYYRITLSGGTEHTIIAENAKEAREQAKKLYGQPVVQTAFDIYRSDLGEAVEKKKKIFSEKMKKLALDYIDFVKEIEGEGLEELVDYKFFSNINHCHIGLSFSSLVDEKKLKQEADDLYEAITQSYLSDKEKIALIVEKVRIIEVFSEETKDLIFSLIRKKASWEKVNNSDQSYGCIWDKNKKICDKCDNSYNCFGVKTIFNDKEVLNLLEENDFRVTYPFNISSELKIEVFLI